MTGKRFIYFSLIAFIGGTFLLVWIQYNSAKNITELVESNEKLMAEFTVRNRLLKLEKNIISIESSIRNAISGGDSVQLGRLNRQIAELSADIAKLQEIHDNDRDMAYIDALDIMVSRKLATGSAVLNTYNTQGRAAAEQLLLVKSEKALTDSIQETIQKIDSSRQKVLVALTATIDESGTSARSWGNILIVVALVSAAAVFWFIINRILQQNHLIRQLDISEKKVRESARVKENFMANMSHEIRTPMNAVLGFTGLLAKKELDAESQEYVQSIKQSGENLLAVINDILDVSKIEAGMLRIESAPFHIRNIVHSACYIFMHRAAEKGLYLDFNVDPGLPEILQGDATRLTQVLVNLIGNAIKFTSEGGVAVSVKSEGIRDDGLLIGFDVADTGIGIAPEMVDAIFNRFQQAEDSITRRYGGTGLGLSIVKDLVRLQDGTISLQSELNRGTTIKVIIPYQPAGSIQSSPGTDIENTSAIHNYSGKEILVVEDNLLNQSLMKHLLQGRGFSCTIIENGVEAIELLRTKAFDLILMDIQMPGMDGYSATKFIRNELKTDTPIIAMTAHALTGEREKCLAAGMNEYLSKPIREISLMQSIGIFIRQSDQNAKMNLPPKKEVFRYIDLQYMKEVSAGNKEYEQAVTAQFLQIIPQNLEDLKAAISNQDLSAIRHIAHDMKTSVAIMGLTRQLSPILDALEYNNLTAEDTPGTILSLQNICLPALKEAREFYDGFKN